MIDKQHTPRQESTDRETQPLAGRQSTRSGKILTAVLSVVVIAMLTIAATQPGNISARSVNTGDPSAAAIDGMGGGSAFTGDTEDAGPGPDSSNNGGSAGDPGEGSLYEGDDSDDAAPDQGSYTGVKSSVKDGGAVIGTGTIAWTVVNA